LRTSPRPTSQRLLEEWKAKFYSFESLHPTSGWPTRKTLEGMGLKKAADVMQNKGKLGWQFQNY
jgi:hypothetical protein